jgi:hypothetical protein
MNAIRRSLILTSLTAAVVAGASASTDIASTSC